MEIKVKVIAKVVIAATVTAAVRARGITIIMDRICLQILFWMKWS